MIFTWIVYIILAAYVVWQAPKAWWDRPPVRILMIALHAVCLGCMFVYIEWFYAMDPGFLRTACQGISIVYYTVLIWLAVCCAVRQVAVLISRKVRKSDKQVKTAGQVIAYFAFILVGLLVFLSGRIHFLHLVSTTYEVKTIQDYSCEPVRIALFADTHVGAGDTEKELVQIEERVIAMDPDVVLMAGDLYDDMTPVDALEDLEEMLSHLTERYPVYYVEGNHDRTCAYDGEAYLKKAGVVILKDEVVTLENGAVILGRRDQDEKDVAEVLEENRISQKVPVLIMQHQPTGYNAIDPYCDLVVSGHTHGYTNPGKLLLYPWNHKRRYGLYPYERMQSVVTSGAGMWGFPMKWPSSNEVVQINLTF